MKQDLTLVIMAAGMGSRFGGLKQIEPVGPNGEFIIDYSIYDAIQCGFTKVVFIIKEENYELFKKTVGERIAKQIQVEYAFQKNDDIPDFVKQYASREKPWGTAHAILCAKPYVNGPFLVINSDDFYGRDGYRVAVDFLLKTSMENHHFASVCYRVGNTLTNNGSVKRAVAYADENGQLTSLIESKIEKENDRLIASPLSGAQSFEVAYDQLVAVNMFCFKPMLFDYLEKDIVDFFQANLDNIDTCEYLIPEVIFKMLQEKLIQVSVLSTEAQWMGVTYREDKEDLVQSIEQLIEQGEYPRDLWKS